MKAWKSSSTCLGRWDDEVWSVRAPLGDTSPKPPPPRGVPGAEAPPNPIGNGSGLPDLAQEFVGWFGSPPGVRIGCEARGGAVESRGGVWAKSP